MQEDLAGLGSENEATLSDSFGSARLGSLGVFTGPHSEEKRTKDKVGCMCLSGAGFVLGSTAE